MTELPAADGPLPDVLDEAERIIALARARASPIRLIGGTAILLETQVVDEPRFGRIPQDVDLMAAKRSGTEVTAVLEAAGYVGDRAFNALNGHRRLLFREAVQGRQVDVFLGEFAMCHAIPIGDRLEVAERSLPLAELLLMKLQIVELNAKDQQDVLRLLLYRPVEDHDRDAINGAYIGALCAHDWGLWRTLRLNLERTRTALGPLELDADAEGRILLGLDRLEAAMDAAPKSRKWKLRDRVGDRVRWYEEPEEVD